MARNYTVFAVDFDGTLCESVWPGIGAPNIALINRLIKRRDRGDKIILWTCREGERLQEAVEWCKGHGLEFDAVNDNLQELKDEFENNPRKIAADVYIDDKNCKDQRWNLPYVVSNKGKSRFDSISHPAHYNAHEYECIDEMETLFGLQDTIAFCKLNAWKYRYRAGNKGNYDEDMAKADWYIGKAMKLQKKLYGEEEYD